MLVLMSEKESAEVTGYVNPAEKRRGRVNKKPPSFFHDLLKSGLLLEGAVYIW